MTSRAQRTAKGAKAAAATDATGAKEEKGAALPEILQDPEVKRKFGTFLGNSGAAGKVEETANSEVKESTDGQE